MTVLSHEVLKDILDYLEKSINNLAIDGADNLEIEGGIEGMKNFLENQFDIRLENLLISKDSSIHHLESGMKNLVIQKKQEIIEKILKHFNN
jgi:DNA-directed RNA polymerase subunit F